MKKIYYLFAFALLILSSCNKYLDVKPKGFTIPEKVNDYRLLLNDQGLLRASAVFPDYLTDNVVSGDNADVSSSASFEYYPFVKRQLYTFAHGAVFEQGQSDIYWENAYSQLFTYNVVINNVLNAVDGTEAAKRQIWAEAKTGRAFEYLSLVNIYSAHYNGATADKDYGVPLVLSEDVNVKYERVSVQKIYDQVKSDLEEALPYLSTTQSNPFQPVKSVSYAFLSRMYLYEGNYSEALKNAKEALKLNDKLLDYKDYTTKDKTTWGRICLKTDPLKGLPDAQTSPEVIWSRLGTSSYGSFNGECYVSSDLIETFKKELPEGAVDKRYELFYCADSSSFGAKVVRFPGRVLYAPYVEFNTGFGTPELYLIAAECEARAGNGAAAVGYLNTLRDNRIEHNKPLVTTDAKQALTWTLDERRRELAFWASARLIDLKRLAVTGDLVKTIRHPLEKEVFEMQSTDPRMILPVPPKVLSINPGIPQYER